MMRRRGVRALAAAAVLTLPALAGAQSIGVTVNGAPVEFYGTQPQQIQGRVMVPLRGVLERLGAVVEWDVATRTAIATRGDTSIRLPIGNYQADVNGRSVPLDVPASVIGGSTMVPLRFVSEALGAKVGWNDQTRSVMITTADGADTGQLADRRREERRREERRREELARQNNLNRDNPPVDNRDNLDRRIPVNPADRRQNRARLASFTLPEGVVIPVRLDTELSSNSSRVGDRFTATVRSGREDAGIPAGSRVEGVVREAIPAERDRPGSIDLDFQRLVLPNGDVQRLDGSLISLESKGIQRDSEGRMMARSNNKNEQLKFIGLGAAGGLLIGALTKNNQLLSTLLGAGAGYLYSQTQKPRPHDVRLGAGTEFGIRMNRSLAYRYNQ